MAVGAAGGGEEGMLGLPAGLPALPAPEPGKRKRGRPRKAPLALGSGLVGVFGGASTAAAPSAVPVVKRGRGRPPGSGSSLSPHVINVMPGEDILAVIMQYPRERRRGVCVLAAHGVVSTATLGRPAQPGATVRIEGRLEILTFSGALVPHDTSAGSRGAGGLSISFVNSDGQVQAGSVEGPLIASTVVQLVLGSFRHGEGPEAASTSVSAEAQAPKRERDPR
eukprot:jgi/Chlat1/1715/Chrsp127S01931